RRVARCFTGGSVVSIQKLALAGTQVRRLTASREPLRDPKDAVGTLHSVAERLDSRRNSARQTRGATKAAGTCHSLDALLQGTGRKQDPVPRQLIRQHRISRTRTDAAEA